MLVENIDSYLEKAWNIHAEKPEEVAFTAIHGLNLIQTNEQVPAFARLITHVFGEHLGRWLEGIVILSYLEGRSFYQPGSESDKAVERAMKSLSMASGDEMAADKMSSSDQIIVHCTAASAVSAHGNLIYAHQLWNKALAIADKGLPTTDPANRALAVAGNNLACTIEEKSVRSLEETKLMILAAQTGAKYWPIAGNWVNDQLAQYRLSQSYFHAGDFKNSLIHAQNCLSICEQNNAEAEDITRAKDAIAKATQGA